MAESDDPAELCFLNRDQIVLAIQNRTGISVVTVLGLKVRITGPPEDLAKFTNELLNALGSNFVSVPPSVDYRLAVARAEP